jgi:iron(III) transport system permease protein
MQTTLPPPRTVRPARLTGRTGSWRTPNPLFVILLACLSGLILVPLFFVVKTSFTTSTISGPGTSTLHNYTQIFTGGNLGNLALNSVIFAVGSGVIAIPVGTFFAWVVERTNTPVRNAAYLAAYVGLAVPGVVSVIGWILLLGPSNGLVTVAFENLFGTKTPPFELYSMAGMILVNAIGMVPLVFLLMVAPFRSMDASMQEAASMSGASPLRVFWRVTSRLARPTVLAVLLLTMVLSLESFEVPALIGIPGGVQVLTTQIYQLVDASLVPQYGVAAAYGVVLMILVSIAIWYYLRATRQASRFAVVGGKGMKPRRTDLGRWRWLTTALIVVLLILLVAPVVAMVWTSFLPYYRAPSLQALNFLTVSNYTGLFSDHSVYSAFLNSAIVAIVSATLAMLLAVLIAWVVSRSSIRLRGLLDYVASVPLVIPGIVLGVGFLQTYVSSPLRIYGTLIILIFAFTAKFIPYATRFASPAMLQVSADLEDAARMSGAGSVTMFRRVILPLMSTSVTSGWIYVFLFGMKELSAALLLYTSNTQMIGPLIYNMWGEGEVVQLSAFGTVVTAVLCVVSFAMRRLTNRVGINPV